MQNRAYSVLSIKAIDEATRTFRGIATTPSVDRVGDIIDPLGITFKNPLPLLHQHKHDAPIGTVEFETPTKDGIKFKGQMPVIEEPGSLKDRVDTAWLELKYGLVRATSIGFRPIEYSFIDNGGIRYSETEVFELSTVTIPAQADAIITAVKSMGDAVYLRTIKAVDAEVRHEEGVPDPEIPEAPKDAAATGKSVRVVKLDEPARDRAPYQIRSIKRNSK